MATFPTESSTPLFDFGETAAATRSAAFASAKPKAPARRQQLLDLLIERGSIGATRHECAIFLGWPLSSVCAPALSLLQDQLVVEIGKRETQFGAMAAVLVAVQFAREAQQ